MTRNKTFLPGFPALLASIVLVQGTLATTAVAAERRFFIDLGGAVTTTQGWNNLSDGLTGTALTSLVDDTGAPSGLVLTVTDAFWQGWAGASNGNGTAGSSLYPSTATQDSLFIGNHMGTLDDMAKLRFSGLSATASYTFRFYASRMTDDLSSDRTALLTLYSQTVELQARNNVNTYAELTNIAPTSGAIDITMTLKPGSVYGYLGVIELIESDSVVANQPPVANAGSNQTITLPTSSVTLAGSASDADGVITSYSWTKLSGGSATFSSSTAASTVVSGLAQGTYAFRLTVTDNQGATASDDVQITVLPVPGGNLPAARTLTARSTTIPNLYNTFVGFYESLPRGYDNDLNRQWPLIIFLHGIGQRGNGTTELPRVLQEGLPQKINTGAQLEYPVNGVNDSFVVLMPQLSASASDFHPYLVGRMIDYGLANYRIDPRRIYVTGLSLGAFTTTAYAEFSLANAQRLAAIAPTDGAGYGSSIWTPDQGTVTYNTCNLVTAGVKVWQFYGANDGSWGWTAADFLNRLNACNPPAALRPKVTIYANTGHSAWGKTYDTGHTYQNPNVYEWLLAQQRPE